MKRKQRVAHLASAGGVVYRTRDDVVEVVLCGRLSPELWALPKGTPDPGETREQTAIREVVEETGLEVGSEGLIAQIDYWFVRPSDGVRCHKTVDYYLMSVKGGDVARHDHEFDVVRWFPSSEALETMTYPNEARVVEKGISLARQKGRGAGKR